MKEGNQKEEKKEKRRKGDKMGVVYRERRIKCGRKNKSDWLTTWKNKFFEPHEKRLLL